MASLVKYAVYLLGMALLPIIAAAQVWPCDGRAASECLRGVLGMKSGSKSLSPVTSPAKSLSDSPDIEFVVTALGEDIAHVNSLKIQPQFLPPNTSVRIPVTALTHDGLESTLWFRIAEYRQVWVWAQSVRAGATVTSDMLSLQMTDVTSMNVAELASPESAAGSTLRNAVHAGDVARSANLRTPQDIDAGDNIRYEIAEQNLRITGTGRALEASKVGHTLRLLPTHTTRPIDALAVARL